MHTINKRISLILILICFLISCTDIVDVEVLNGGERLVIEASINWEKGTLGNTQSIKISKSTPYFEETTNTPVIDASVLVTKDDDGTQFVFNSQNNGEYITTNFIPLLGQSYTLEILYNGNTYTANETLMAVSNITNIEQRIENGFDGEEEIKIKLFFNDPIDTHNYYLGEFIPSHKPLLSLSALDDDVSNGNENSIDYEAEDLESGVTVDINLYGISENYYRYISLLIEQSSEDGGPFQPTPVQLVGNCKNINNPNEEVLGYFRLGEVDKTTYTVE